MQVTITINCENAAFEPYAGTELARILNQVADRVRDYANPSEVVGWTGGMTLKDINGNTVGQMKVRG